MSSTMLQKFGPRPVITIFRNKRGRDTIAGFLQIYECSVKGVSGELCLIDKSIGQEDVIRTTVPSRERALKRVRNIFSDHKRHKAIIEGASEQLT